MAESKHTLGPYTVEQIGRRPVMKAVAATVLSASGERLADFRHVADANLFAVAPEMLEALTLCQAALATMIAPEAIKSTTVLNAFAQATEAEFKVRAALAKAGA